MAKNVIKTETTAEQYMAEVIGPKIEAIEESLDSLKEDQATVLNAIKNDNEALRAKFEEMRATKAQGRQCVLYEKENVDASLKDNISNLLNDNLVKRTIKVETSAEAHIGESDMKMLKDLTEAFRGWTESNKARTEALEKSRRPFIRIAFGKAWYKWTLIIVSSFSLFAIAYVHYSISRTPESWADRSYRAGLELNEDNPGAAYHEAIQGFKNGYDAETRQKVSDREIAGKERTKRKRQYEKELNRYLAEVESMGVTVTNYLEEVKKNGGVESLVFLYLNRNSDLSGVAHISVDKGIAFSFDSKITSIKQAEKYASHKIWHYVGNLAKPCKADIAK